jgi:hypothetical protein
MAARTTLATVISDVRALTSAGPNEYTKGTANYFDDDQVQRILDRHRADVFDHVLAANPARSGGTLVYQTYVAGLDSWEETDGGTATFVITALAGGTVVPSGWSADYQRGIVTFTADQGPVRFAVTGRRYDIYGAAAEVLRVWATQKKAACDFTIDGQAEFVEGQTRNMLSLAKEYAARAEPMTVALGRNDIAPGW